MQFPQIEVMMNGSTNLIIFGVTLFLYKNFFLNLYLDGAFPLLSLAFKSARPFPSTTVFDVAVIEADPLFVIFLF